MSDGEIRVFDSGATRDSDTNKLDFEGFLSPLAIECYAQYMHKHRKQSNGEMRASDNWQKGIPIAQYVKSLFRHFLDVWFIYRGWRRFDLGDGHEISIEEALCGVVFNAMGCLHEVLFDQIPPTQSLYRGDAA